MKLTDAQEANLRTIKEVGGIIFKDKRGFHRPGTRATIPRMNAVAVQSLIKLGLLTLTPGETQDEITVAARVSCGAGR